MSKNQNTVQYPASAEAITGALLAWYDAGHRDLPWRPRDGSLGDPYHVWLSEVMLQQTTVAAVIPYYKTFLNLWPTLVDLAAANDGDVMTAWAGLGYYSRARNLLACARTVEAKYGGVFPGTVSEIKALPGCGPYTASAIAAIAFGVKTAAVDGNVERILARLMDDDTLLPQFKGKAQGLADGLASVDRPGDFVQASIELGALICRPKSPKCDVCPWGDWCQSRQAGTVIDRPKRPLKVERPKRYGLVYWVEQAQSHDQAKVWVVRRPPKGLLGGMLALPSPDWSVCDGPLPPEVPDGASAWDVTVMNAPVRHIFTHFSLELTVIRVSVPNATTDTEVCQAFGDGQWQKTCNISAAGFPTVFKKVIKVALA